MWVVCGIQVLSGCRGMWYPVVGGVCRVQDMLTLRVPNSEISDFS